MNTIKIEECKRMNSLEAHTVLICGDRDWGRPASLLQGQELRDYQTPYWRPINDLLNEMPTNTLIIEGRADGADKMAGYAASRNFGYNTCGHPANWTLYNKRAGFLRNKEMLDMHPEINHVYAFHDDIDASKGTLMMLRLAQKRGIATTILTSTGNRIVSPVLAPDPYESVSPITPEPESEESATASRERASNGQFVKA